MPTRRRKEPRNLVALDTEATGLDIYHGARPFLVTVSNGDSTQWWEWEVEPVSRKVLVNLGDAKEIADVVNDPSVELVLQNPKFDAMAMVEAEIVEAWPWSRTWDTLLAGHLLASNRPKDLTSLVLEYLAIDISHYDDKLRAATTKARTLVRSKQLGWRLAAKGESDMPSAKDTVWKYDTWLPRQLAKLEGYPEDHEWYTVCSDYANSDSGSTYHLFQVMLGIIQDRGLWEIYLERLKLLEVVYAMERTGVSVSRSRLRELEVKYGQESTKHGKTCDDIAIEFNYDLVLPKGATNNSLRTFIFDKLQLPVVDRSKKTGEPTLNKSVLEEYQATLPEDSDGLRFVNALRAKRKCDTARQYMEGYRRYWVEIPNAEGWYLLHPSINLTGTDTLRCSSQNPNEQNISKQEGFNLRYCFGPAPGREWWSLDAKNIELRLPAYESGEQELIELFERPDDPPYYGSVHLLNFSTVYDDLWAQELKVVGIEKVGPHCKKKYESTWYQWCKNGGFAVQYGAVEKEDGTGTADRAFHRPGSHAKLKSRFNKLEGLNRKYIWQANQQGYVETIPDRSVNPKRGYPLLCTRNSWGGILETVPLNYHVQGSAMWWMCKAMVRCYAYLKQVNRQCVVQYPYYADRNRYRIVMQVHDELVFDFPKDDYRTPKKFRSRVVIEECRRLMELGGEDYGIPTPVDIEHNPVTWSEGE